MSTPLLGHRYFVKPEDGPGDGGTLCQIIDRTNVFTANHWGTLPMTTERIARHYDRHTLETAGDDLPRVWTDDDALRFWRGMLLGGVLGIASWLAVYSAYVLLGRLVEWVR